MELDERKQRILQGVVWSYVATAEPVGSENLAQRYSWWGVKSATIRNVLADLDDLGYLRQPHTSAGRIPSDQGYRFYVNHLIFETEIEQDVAQQTKADLERESADNLERILRQTCALLSRMTHYTSVATRPQPSDISLRQVFVAPAGGRAILLVAILSTGQSETRMITGSAADYADEDPSALTRASNALNAIWATKTLSAIALAGDDELRPNAALASDDSGAIYSVLAASLRGIARMAGEDRTVIEGAREMFRQPEFHDVQKLDPVLETIQMQPHVVDKTQRGTVGDVSVVIGGENPVEPLKECSVVTASYYIGTRERGTLGVVGPTRMDYDRTIPAVSFMARSLSDVLTRLAQ